MGGLGAAHRGPHNVSEAGRDCRGMQCRREERRRVGEEQARGGQGGVEESKQGGRKGGGGDAQRETGEKKPAAWAALGSSTIIEGTPLLK